MGLGVALCPEVSGWLPLSPGTVLSQRQAERWRLRLQDGVGRCCCVVLALPSPSRSQVFCLSHLLGSSPGPD